ncbi:hypothetical protein CTEN210_11539 [Chaetoceros tenuissimus]|uniref:Leucine-rich repeat domain-containing protein n=1 Tax=Chaetoceros tenuissimus TaxID=426638 RepID=A0AAD3CZV3_9STRA|nr:hypothetical protein CTEN210_11539 [Chaetoceros tenuissimus]
MRLILYDGQNLLDETGSAIPVASIAKEKSDCKHIKILDGVTTIHSGAFRGFDQVLKLTLADTVEVIESHAFEGCHLLVEIVWSRNLRVIGYYSFGGCKSIKSLVLPPLVSQVGISAFNECRGLTSVFLPERLAHVGPCCFRFCEKLIILQTSANTSFGYDFISGTRLLENSSFENCNQGEIESIKLWLLDRHNDSPLHQICCSTDSSLERIIQVVKDEGSFASLVQIDSLGLTPLDYLDVNPFVDFTQPQLVKYLVLDMMGQLESIQTL